MQADERVKRVRRGLLWLSVAALVLGALPLYAISLYNHPYYDDYGFSAQAHQAWRDTGSVGAVLRAAWESALETRQGWQGTYTGTLLSNVQPGIFSEQLYFIGTFVLLTAFIACFLCFFSVVMGRLGMDRTGRWTLGCLAVTLMIQFMPDAGEAFFWFNGGIGNTFIYSLMALAAALMVRLAEAKGRAVGLTAALCVLMVLLGGGSYGGGLLSVCMLAVCLVWMLRVRHPRRWRFAGLAALLLLCFAYSMSAPGNAVRAGVIGYRAPAVKAVLQALYYGVAQMSAYLRPALIAVTLAALPALYGAAKKSPWRFSHPWLVLGLTGALYCTQMTPPLYAIASIGAGRIVNTYFISFVALWFPAVYYLAGFAARRLEAAGRGQLIRPLTARGYGALLAVSLCLLGMGCLACRPAGEALYGVQNMNGPSAALSILSGEAARYDAEMTLREEALNDPAQPVVTLSPLTAVPDVFMDDLIVPGAEYDVRPSLAAYYGKEAILIAGEEENADE